MGFYRPKLCFRPRVPTCILTLPLRLDLEPRVCRSCSHQQALGTAPALGAHSPNLPVPLLFGGTA